MTARKNLQTKDFLASPNLSGRLKGIIRRIGEECDQRGLSSYVVGGFVRDVLLKRDNGDLDVVVEGDAVELARCFARQDDVPLKVYPRFGTATLEYPRGIRVDVAGARKERYPHPGALPVVGRGTIQDDLFRRDFTINALAVSISLSRWGEWVDPFGGRKDLRKGKIRVLHDQSFIDDPTRILRAIRFEQRFGFSLERKTAVQLRSALKQGAEATVKAPRYFAEFRKILREPFPRTAILRLQKLGGLEFLFKDFRAPADILKRLEKHHGLLRTHLEYRAVDLPMVYLSALAMGLNEEQRQEFARKVQLPNVEKTTLSLLSKVPDAVARLRKRQVSPGAVYQILSPLSLEIIFFIHSQSLDKMLPQRIGLFLKKWSKVKLEITGDDLKNLGVGSGETMGKILKAVHLEKVEGKVSGHRQELNAAKILWDKIYSPRE